MRDNFIVLHSTGHDTGMNANARRESADLLIRSISRWGEPLIFFLGDQIILGKCVSFVFQFLVYRLLRFGTHG